VKSKTREIAQFSVLLNFSITCSVRLLESYEEENINFSCTVFSESS
jgi:hypothetical protein